MNQTRLLLAGRTAVVTGAASGIGRALALAAAKRGMAVAMADLDDNGLRATEAGVRALGAECVSERVSVTDAAALHAFAERTEQALPPVTLLFANAGILQLGSLLKMPISELKRLFDVNVFGAIATVQAFVPRMRDHGPDAHIVITGSTGSMANYADLGGYCAAKHALWPIAEAIRNDLSAAGSTIGVSLLMPGAVSTAIFDQADPDRAASAETMTPDEVADIAFRGIDQGDFLILTHPSFISQASARFDVALSELKRGTQVSATAFRTLEEVPG